MFTNVEVVMAGIIVGLLGIGGGKLWSNAKIKDLREAIDAMKEHCNQCHTECKEIRVNREHALETEVAKIKIDVGATLEALKQGQEDVRVLLQKQAKISEKKQEAIDSLRESYHILSGWLERNGFVKK